jgi:hypothetical protein
MTGDGPADEEPEDLTDLRLRERPGDLHEAVSGFGSPAARSEPALPGRHRHGPDGTQPRVAAHTSGPVGRHRGLCAVGPAGHRSGTTGTFAPGRSATSRRKCASSYPSPSIAR